MSAPHGSARIGAAFARARAEGRAALVTFITGGDPSPAATPALLDALVAGGADVIEIGLPFTDPMADGPAIQRANLRSLASGTRTRTLLEIVHDFRGRHPAVPLILMGYANTMIHPSPESFADAIATAGIDGVIAVDLPPEEDGEIAPHLRARGLGVIRLATPTTDDQRLPAVLNGASGFLYYVSVAGITGLQQAETAAIAQATARLRAATDLPVAVGFGVRTPEQAKAFAFHADGVVVGSAIIDLIERDGDQAATAVRDFVASLSAALRAAGSEAINEGPTA